MALEDDILATLSRKPGLKGREIASQLGLDKGLVNSTLYKLRSRKLTWQDGGYRWCLKAASTESRQAAQPQLDTPLTKLSRYYLHCLSLDDESGVSLFAQSRFSAEYIELPVLPELDPEERSIASFAGVSELFQRLRTSASRQVPYLGYPVRLRAHRSEKGWEGFFVEPVFLFDFTDDALQRGADPALTGELPTFNFRVLKSLAMGDDSQIMDEAARLAEELGFSEAEPPELDEFFARLVEIREDWDWKEQMNPASLSSGTVVLELERMLVRQGYRGSVGVVTPFRAQANKIRDLLHAHPQANLMLKNGELLVDTVHRFQGDERDVMIFSPVVSRAMPQGASIFLRKTGNLFNVAITRARATLVVVGDFGAARNSDIEHLSAFAGYVERLNTNTARAKKLEREDYDGGPNYPTVAHPELVSDWERLFYTKLHQAGLRPVPQYDVEKFILDFALISGGRRLDVEVDGERYHRDWTGELLRRDQLRNMRLIELGWDVMRFWVYELRDNMPPCIERVKRWMRC